MNSDDDGENHTGRQGFSERARRQCACVADIRVPDEILGGKRGGGGAGWEGTGLVDGLSEALFRLVVKGVLDAARVEHSRPGRHPGDWWRTCRDYEEDTGRLLRAFCWISVAAIFQRRGLGAVGNLLGHMAQVTLRLRASAPRRARVDFPLFLAGVVGDAAYLLLTFAVPAAQGGELEKTGYTRVTDLASLLVTGTLRLDPNLLLIHQVGARVAEAIRVERAKVGEDGEGVLAPRAHRIPIFFPNDYKLLRRKSDRVSEDEQSKDPAPWIEQRKSAIRRTEKILKRIGFEISSDGVVSHTFETEEDIKKAKSGSSRARRKGGSKRSQRRVALTVSALIYKAVEQSEDEDDEHLESSHSSRRRERQKHGKLSDSLRKFVAQRRREDGDFLSPIRRSRRDFLSISRPTLATPAGQTSSSEDEEDGDEFGIGHTGKKSTTFLTSSFDPGPSEAFVPASNVTSWMASSASSVLPIGFSGGAAPKAIPVRTTPSRRPRRLSIHKLPKEKRNPTWRPLEQDVVVGSGSVLSPPQSDAKDIARTLGLHSKQAEHSFASMKRQAAKSLARARRVPPPTLDPPHGLVNHFKTEPPVRDSQGNVPRSILVGDLADPNWRAILDPRLQGALDDLQEGKRLDVEGNPEHHQTNPTPILSIPNSPASLRATSSSPMEAEMHAIGLTPRPDQDDNDDDTELAILPPALQRMHSAATETTNTTPSQPPEKSLLLHAIDGPSQALRQTHAEMQTVLRNRRRETKKIRRKEAKTYSRLRRDPLELSDFARELVAKRTVADAAERAAMRRLAATLGLTS